MVIYLIFLTFCLCRRCLFIGSQGVRLALNSVRKSHQLERQVCRVLRFHSEVERVEDCLGANLGLEIFCFSLSHSRIDA